MKAVRIRDYKKERENGQLDFLEALESVREERQKETFDILQLAQIFVFCSLPYRPSEERQLSHVARLGNGKTVEVVFTAMRPDVPIAFGNDRSLLYWLVDKAIRENSAYVSWEHAVDYLKATGQGTGGRNLVLLRQRFMRIASTAITVIRNSGEKEDQVIMPIVRRTSLPSSITGKKSEGTALERRMRHETFGLEFDEGFVKDFREHRVPVLRSLLLATQARPQMQDCMFFLIWRSYSAGNETVIPWDRLRDQFWQTDKNQSRIRLRFEEAISMIRTAWPELQSKAMPKGLLIAPPKNGIQFVPQLERPKHIAAVEAAQADAKKRERLDQGLRKLGIRFEGDKSA